MIRNATIDEIRSSIHSRPIPWKGLNRANVVTEEEVQSFESLGKLSSQERVERVQSGSAKYAELSIQLFTKDIRDDLVKYLVLFIVEYGHAAPAFAESLASRKEAFSSLSALLSRKDEQITLLAAVAIVTLASATNRTLGPAKDVEAIFRYIIQNLLLASSSDINYKDLGIQLLVKLLQSVNYRAVFHSLEHEAVPLLLGSVASSPLQVQYGSLLALWILSFDKSSATKFITEFNVVPVILDAARAALKEKIVRISMATLANILRFAPKSAAPILIAEGALSTIRQLETRKWNDEELQEDLNYVRDALNRAFEKMTTFEEYTSELNAQRLRWTPVHKNHAFWIENIDQFKDHDWAPLKQLVKLTSESEDAVTLAVACHDIANIVERAPEATQVITRVGGKVQLMKLIANHDAEVRYEALKATQKMISHIFV